MEIDPDRLLADLAALREIGAVGSGVVRQAFSEADIAARRWFAERAQASGLAVRWDPAGNVFAMPPSDAPAILIGSHSDTQPEGGWLDGAYGVVCGLEIARAAQESGRGGVAAVSFSDEEGCFQPLMGSRHWTGALSLAELDTFVDQQDRRLGDLRLLVPETRDAAPVPVDLFRCYLEPHIEQGPVLDRAAEEIGIVTDIAGLRHIEFIVRGDQNHAGTTPMSHRKDAFQAFVGLVAAINDNFCAMASPVAVWTFGQLDLHPNAVSIVPGRVRAVLQIRDAELAALDAMARRAFELAAEREIEARLLSAIDPVRLDERVIDAVGAAAAEITPQTSRRMISGALHDAGVVAARLPAGMLFVPSIGGRSHRFDEDTRLEHLVLGCSVAAAAVARLL